MVDGDKKRFVALLTWLCRKYPVEGRSRTLPVGDDLADYFAALRDLAIEDVEGGARWHYAHSEFYPDRPAALRKSVRGWQDENPKPVARKFSPRVTAEQILAERCEEGKFSEFMERLVEMGREKFGDSVRDDRGRLKPVAGDQRSRLMEQKQQLALMAGSD